MREILFRGKRKDNDEWVYGYYSPCIWYPSKKQTPSIKELPYGNDVEIISETVCQYTGLTDRNHKQVFEGDIVKCHYEDYYNARDFIKIVGYIEGTFGLEDNEKRGFLAFINRSAYVRYFEVIGNIYDNPELLKEARYGN